MHQQRFDRASQMFNLFVSIACRSYFSICLSTPNPSEIGVAPSAFIGSFLTSRDASTQGQRPATLTLLVDGAAANGRSKHCSFAGRADL
jgi:hypothetical protein